MPKPRVYVETTIPSFYYDFRESPAVVSGGRRHGTGGTVGRSGVKPAQRSRTNWLPEPAPPLHSGCRWSRRSQSFQLSRQC